MLNELKMTQSDVITDIQYFGSISYIKHLMQLNLVYFNENQNYTKMSFKNRMVIGTAQGPLHLSIPIIGGRDQKISLKEIEIAYHSPWMSQHYKSIVSNYKRSPFFEYYHDDIKEIYNSQPVYLYEFLIHINEWVRKQIKGKWEISKQQPNHSNYQADQWLPKNYDLVPNPIKYQQVFEDNIGFMPNLCILDILFCCGGKQTNTLLMTT
jgi:hypothetical protein